MALPGESKFISRNFDDGENTVGFIWDMEFDPSMGGRPSTETGNQAAAFGLRLPNTSLTSSMQRDSSVPRGEGTPRGEVRGRVGTPGTGTPGHVPPPLHDHLRRSIGTGYVMPSPVQERQRRRARHSLMPTMGGRASLGASMPPVASTSMIGTPNKSLDDGMPMQLTLGSMATPQGRTPHHVATTPLSAIFSGKKSLASTRKAAASTLPRPEESWFGERLKQFRLEGGDRREHMAEVFSVAHDFAAICESARPTKGALPSTNVELERVTVKAEEDRLLRSERNTWKLLEALFHHRVQARGSAGTDVEMQAFVDVDEVSDLQVIDQLCKDPTHMEHKIVVQWLEDQATEASFHAEVSSFARSTLLAARTRTSTGQRVDDYLQKRSHDVRAEFSGVPYGDLVHEMDPDAPVRERARWDDHDKDMEENLLKSMWSLVRAGRVSEAASMCRHCGQHWRAASVSGGKFYSDPLAHGRVDQDIITGNPDRKLWKQMCAQLAQENGFSDYEQAVYGALSGSVAAVFPVCSSWEDYLWVQYKAKVDAAEDAAIDAATTGGLNIEDDAAAHKLPEAIFNEAENRVANRTADPFHSIQRALILNNVEDLLGDCLSSHEWSSASGVSTVLLRFFTHLYLFLREVAVMEPTSPFNEMATCEAADKIIERYVDHLVETRQTDLVALYTAYLPRETQTAKYSAFLQQVTGLSNEQRRECLELAREVELDVPEITKAVVALHVRGTDRASSSTQAPPMALSLVSAASASVVAERSDDEDRIKAIQWLCFDPRQRGDALLQANAIIRLFIVNEKMELVDKLLAELPDDTVPSIMASWEDPEFGPPVENNAINEFTALQSYATCKSKFREWTSTMAARPAEPVMAQSQKYSDELSYEHKRRNYEEDMAKWAGRISQVTRATMASMWVVLDAPHGWLADFAGEDEDAQRQEEIYELRKKCIPEVAFMYHKVAYDAAEFNEESDVSGFQKCLDLADHIAEKDYELYTLFTPEQMREYLVLVRRCCLQMMRVKADPLGYYDELPY